jgi:hypothetical protein
LWLLVAVVVLVVVVFEAVVLVRLLFACAW